MYERSFVLEVIMGKQTVTQGGRTKSEITHVAYRPFLEQGYPDTSMRQIAQESA